RRPARPGPGLADRGTGPARRPGRPRPRRGAHRPAGVAALPGPGHGARAGRPRRAARGRGPDLAPVVGPGRRHAGTGERARRGAEVSTPGPISVLYGLA